LFRKIGEGKEAFPVPKNQYVREAWQSQGAVVFYLPFKQWQWIPAFAGMTLPQTSALDTVIAAKAGIRCPPSLSV
jgi:hypothetical protein